MKYIIRALRYFIYICIVMAIVLLVFIALGVVSSDVNVMFRNGYTSVLEIVGMFLVISFIYPHFGFGKRSAIIPGEFSELHDGIVDFMKERKYDLEKEDDGILTFRIHSKLTRTFRMFEDRITITPEFGGVSIEGLSKDIVRLVSGLEYRFRHPNEESEV